MWPQVESAGSAVTQRAALAPTGAGVPGSWLRHALGRSRRAEHSGREGGCGAAGRAGQRRRSRGFAHPTPTPCPPHPPCPPRRDPKVALASNAVTVFVLGAIVFGGLFPDQVASLWGLPPK